MHRRQYLATIASVGGITTVGCVDERPPDMGTTPTATPRSVGEVVTYGGLEMAVTQVRTPSELTTADSPDKREEGNTITPEQSGTLEPDNAFVAGYVRIKHVGESEISFPDLDVRSIQMTYNGRGADTVLVSALRVSGLRSIDDKQAQAYHDNLEQKGADVGASSGTMVEGWVIFQVPEDFVETDAFIAIREDGERRANQRFVWRLGL